MLLDTSGLFAIISRRDENHLVSQALSEAAARRLVHTSIVTEFIALAEARGESRARALKFVDAILDDPEFEMIWLDEEDHRQALALLKARPDKRYSLCDAASFVIMRRMNIREALTTDHHFEQEGFIRLLKP